MTPRVSAAGAISRTTEVLEARLLLDIHGDQFNFFPSMRTITERERRLLQQALFFRSTYAPCEPTQSAIIRGYNEFRAFGVLKDDGDLTVTAGVMTSGAAL